MAREDILPQLLRTLMKKEGPPEESDNSILQKMIIPYDQASMSDVMSISSVPTTTRLWGTFKWSMSQWGNVIEKMIAPQDTATVSDSIKVVKLPGATQPWGNFAWSMNEYWSHKNITWLTYQYDTSSSFASYSWNSLGAIQDWSDIQNGSWSSISTQQWVVL